LVGGVHGVMLLLTCGPPMSDVMFYKFTIFYHVGGNTINSSVGINILRGVVEILEVVYYLFLRMVLHESIQAAMWRIRRRLLLE